MGNHETHERHEKKTGQRRPAGISAEVFFCALCAFLRLLRFGPVRLFASIRSSARAFAPLRIFAFSSPRLVFLSCLSCVSWFLLASSISLAAAEPANPRLTGTPLLRVWRAEDYDAALANTRLLIHPGGFVYVANDEGVLEFDGERWRLIPLPGRGAARSLALDPTGKLWVFGHDDVARLEPDARGELHAVSALELLPADARATGTINRAVSTAEGVYARGQRRLMLFRPDGTVQTWTGASLAGLVWTLEGQLYADLDTLVRVTPAGVTPIALGPGEAPKDADDVRVFATQRFAVDRADEWLLLTKRGPMRWRGDGTPFVPLAASAAELFGGDLASAGAFLPDGRLALGTERSGLYILERDGRLSQHLDREDGLPGNRVLDLAVDAEGGLWVGMFEGLARVDLASPFALHGAPQGLAANARRFASWRGQLYLATSDGMARRDPATGKFVAIAGFQVGSNRPLPLGDRLLAATRGLREVTVDDQSRLLTSELIGPLVAARGPRATGWLYAGSSTGLSLLAPDPTTGGWKPAGRLGALNLGLDELLERDAGWLWAVSRRGEIVRVDFRDGPQPEAPAKIFSPDEGIPPAGRNDGVQLLPLGPDLIAVSNGWIRRYDPKAERFVTEDRLRQAGAPVHGVRLAARAAQEGSAWMRPTEAPGALLQVTPEGAAWQTTARSLAPFRAANFDSLFEEATTSTLWFSGQGLLVSLDLARREGPAATTAPRVFVRRVEAADGTLLVAVGGASDTSAKASGNGSGADSSASLQLAAEQNAVRITYAAANFSGDYRGRAQTQYRTKLEGLDREWSAWSTQAQRDFTNLPHGTLRFLVEARVPDRPVGSAQPLLFTIATPRWLTPWAIAGYVAAGAGAIFGLVRWRLRRLQRRNAQLEALVAARTQQLERINQELTAAVQVVAHDLRGPVSGIRSLARQLRASPEILASPDGPEFLGEIERTSGAAVDMMARLLDLQRASDRAAGLTLAPVDVGAAVADTCRQLQLLAQAKNIWLGVVIEGGERGTPSLLRLTDAEGVMSVVANLVSNAIKFLPSDGRGRVQVTVSASETLCRVRVADNGPGIPPADRTRVFEKFAHGAARPTGGESSTGLGLFIVKKLVDALGGTIAIETTTGGGATFVVEWPAARVER